MDTVAQRSAGTDDRRLERVLLVAAVLVVCVAAWVVASARGASGETAPVSACVTEVVDAAQAFTDVLGDVRPVDGGFARQHCLDAASRA